MNLLTQYQSIIPKFQFEQFKEYFQHQADIGELRSTQDFSHQLDEAIKLIDPNNLPTFTSPHFSLFGRTRSRIYNKMMDYIKIDLSSLYKESNLSFHILGIQENLSKDFNDNVNDAIIHLKGELIAQKIKFGNVFGQKRTTFESFTDMVGKMYVNTRVRHGDLTLDTYSTEIHIYTVENAEVYRYPGGGVEIFKSKVNDVELTPEILQPGLHLGYWAEMILSDVIPGLQFYNHDIVPQNKTFMGILAVLRLTFATPISLNGLDIDPFTIFDIRIPWIRYRRDDSDEWIYLTSDSIRISGIGREIITFKNIDRINHVKYLEIPFWQVNSITDRYTIPKITKSKIEFLEDVFTEKYKNIQNIQTNDIYLPSEETGYDIANNIVMTDRISEVFDKLSALLGIDPIRFKRIGSNFIREEQPKDELFLDQTEKYEYVYGAYSILPMDIKYRPRGAFFSSPIDLVPESINSFSIFVSDSQPDITSANYFIQIDSGQKYQLLPMGRRRIKEHIPVEDDITILPRAYTTDEFSANEYNIQSGCLPTTFNKFIPTFYVDTSYYYKVYRNGIEISGIMVDPKERYLYNEVSGEIAELSSLASTDIIVADYYVDDLYQPPGRIIFPSVFDADISGETSGTFAFSLEGMNPLDISKDYDLYFGLPETQWIKLLSSEYLLEDEIILVSGDVVYNYISGCVNITSLDGLRFMFEYYSTTDEFNGNFGRRDFPGSPYIVDLTQFHLGRLMPDFGEPPKPIVFKMLGLQRFSGKFKLNNYVIELPVAPAIDFRLYNYDGTWNDDPNTGKMYTPIEVKFGDIVAVDRTNYLAEKDTLHPFEEIGEHEFYLKKNFLYFNIKESLTDVTVAYNYVTKDAKLKIELDSNVPLTSSYTPVVHDYTLGFGTIDW